MLKKKCKKFLCKIPIFGRLFVKRARLKWAETYEKDTFSLIENAFEHIYESNMWNDSQSRSGGGSEISATTTIRKVLPLIWEKYKIKTFLDVPCGDFNWMKEVDKTNIKYIGGDIVKEVIERNNEQYGTSQIKFEKIDITKDILPKVDMIFCKDCLQHLCYEGVFNALQNFKRSGAKYLMVTSYPLTLKNHDILDGDYRALNLLKSPFNLRKNYVFKVREKGKGGYVEMDKTMYLWRISDIQMENKQIL